MQYELEYPVSVFEYEDHSDFRILEINGQPWFVLGDVCRALELQTKNGSYAHHAEDLDGDERQTVARSVIEQATSPSRGDVRRVAPMTAIISESGLYTLILRSRKPEAKRFKKWITSEVLPSLRRTGVYRMGGAAAFIRRYNENWDRVDIGYFSVISELVWWLWGRLAHVGHIMADTAPDGTELRPDVSVGRRFADWLRENHPDKCNSYKTYTHVTPEWEGEARQYPNDLLPMFRQFVDTVWIPQHSRDYFKTRDPVALPYLPKLLPPPVGSRTALPRPPRPVRREGSGLIATPPVQSPMVTRRI